MSNCTSVNIFPNNFEVVVVDNSNTITIVNNNCTTQVNVTQEQTQVVQVYTGHPGGVGPVGPIGPSGSTQPFSYVTGSTWNTTSSIEITGSFTVSGSNTFKNIGPAIFSGSVNISSSTIIDGYIDLLNQNNIPSSSNGRMYYKSGSDGFVFYSTDPTNNEYHTQWKNLTSSLGVYLSNAGGTKVQFGSTTNDALGFYVNGGSPKIRIATNGNVAINSTLDHVVPFNINGNTNITGSLLVTGGITSSLQGTASYANQALTASYLSGSVSVFPYTGSAIISGSLNITGSFSINNTGSGTTGTGSLVFSENPTLNTVTLNGQTTFNSFAKFNTTIYSAGSNSTWIIQNAGTNSNLLLQSRSSSGNYNNFMFHSLGFFGINRLSPSMSLDVSGSGRFTDGLEVTGSNKISGSFELTGSSKTFLTGSDIVNIGNKNTTSQRLVRIGQHTSYIDLGSLVNVEGFAAIYFDQGTPSTTNYILAGDSGNSLLNSTTNIGLRINNGDKLTISSTLTDIKQNTTISGSTLMTGSLVVTGSTNILGSVSMSSNLFIGDPTATYLKIANGASIITLSNLANDNMVINAKGSGGIFFGYNGHSGGVSIYDGSTSNTVKITQSSSICQIVSNNGNGNICLNNGSLLTGSSTGFPYIPTCAGAPNGTPTPINGMVPIIYDSVNNKLYIYNGGWKSGSFV